MTTEAVRLEILARAKALRRQAEYAVESTRDDLLATARKNSEGTISAAALRRLDYPYARRHGSSPFTLGIINRQSGELSGSWAEDGPRAVGGGLLAMVFNTSPHARYLYDPQASKFPDYGTKRMFGRDLPDLTIDEVRPRFERRVAHVLDLLTG